MQTFLPYPSFLKSAAVLDYRRLGKQRLECKQLLKALGYEVTASGKLQQCEPTKSGWVNHPAARMWKGYEMALAQYQMIMIMEWLRRGYNNTMNTIDPCVSTYHIPKWFGNKEFHASHRSNLLRKDPVHYGQFGWKEPPDLPYIWPTN